jgi:tRNA(Ile)-lysidine synthase
MANSRKLNCNLTERVADTLFPVVPQNSSLLLGLSGGLDSVVLLHQLHSLAPRFSWQISALHVHHGLSPNADAWADFCRTFCAEYKIPLKIEYVNIESLRSEHGIESAARKLRQKAFFLHRCDFIVLAQHADDQVETILLQLMRGSGIKGLAAMPLLKPATFCSHPTLRPFIDIKRNDLLRYAQAHQLVWVEDESNRDESYPRNFLRHRLMPVLAEKFPAYQNTLSRSARHFAEAGELLDELAIQDSQGWQPHEPLAIQLINKLSLPRKKNLMRYILQRSEALMPQENQLQDMLRQLCDAREDATICVNFGEWQVRRYQGKIYLMSALSDFDSALTLPWNGEEQIYWQPFKRQLIFERKQGQGISLEKLQSAPVIIRLRSGSEVMRAQAKGPHRTLKNLLQEHHIPPWQRERLPLLYCGNELVCVVGVVANADFLATHSELGIAVR